MARPSLFSVLFVVMAFIGGFDFGLYRFGSPPPAAEASTVSAPSAAPTPAQSKSDVSDTWAKFHQQEGEQDAAAQREKQDAAILADRLAFSKKYHLTPQAFGDDLKVTQAMADFLKMTDQERAALDRSLAQTSEETKKMEQHNLKLVKQTDNSVVYQISAYPEGQVMQDDLKKMIEDELGPDRAEVFLQNSKWEFNENFAGFGTSTTTVEVKRTDQSGPPSYTLTETYGDGSSMERGIGTTLPARYAGLMQLDPTP